MDLGRALRRLRRDQGLTLAELAERTGSHVGNLSRIERGMAKPSLDLLYRMAAALDFTLTDIFSVSEQRQQDSKQVALNAIFISLLDHDRALLLDFAKLLQERASREMDRVFIDGKELPAEERSPEEISGKGIQKPGKPAPEDQN